MSKNKIKKSLVLALALVAAAGCANAKTESDRQENGGTAASNGTSPAQTESADIAPEKGASLLVWESDGNERAFLQEVGKQFESAYGVKVKVEVVPSIDTVGKLMTDGPAGLGADVFSSPHDAIGKAVSAGLLLPNDRTQKDMADNVMPSVAQAITYKDVLYGYPMSADTYALYYNRKLMPKEPTTFDELLAFGREFTDPAAKKYGLAWDVAQIYQAHAFIAGYGGYIFGDGGTNPDDIGLNGEGAVEGIKFARSLKALFPLNTADINNNVISGLFQEGRAAMMIDGTWQMANLRKAGVDFGVVQLPLLPNGKHPQSLISVRSLFVNSYTKYPNAAKLFAELATSRDNAKLRYEMTAQLPTRRDLVSDPSIMSDPNVSSFLAQLQNATPLPVIPETSTLWVPSFAALSVIWNDDRADIKKTLDNMVSQMRTAMKTSG
ncbi:maltose ABC transporter substrate-binding protein [Cohnella sp. GCM10012308]|uniref:sugar ABC transporter substrate-binding protein n=1 Tax=Cohnella sp. GCM10012308 TaxID=3317329 RepID=UPI003620C388